MSKINNGGAAFPSQACGTDGLPMFEAEYGMTLRDWFATHALGMGFDWTNLHETGGYDEAATVAYEVADAMLKAREGGTP